MDTLATPGVVVINEDMSHRFWPGQDPIGKRFHTDLTAPFFEVIGVVKDDCLVKNVCDDFAPAEPAVYVPLAQAARFTAADAHVVRQMQVLIRVDHRPKASEERMSKHLAAEVRGDAAALDAQLTRELGVRMALGAQRADVLSLVLKQSVTLIGIGVVTGLAGSWALSRAMRQVFERMGGFDPMAFAGSSALLALVAMTACYLPARRATMVDPVVALRHD
jgi:putative ABC transport system permease protein